MAAFEWPIDKLSLIQSALAQTGDNIPNVANDGSDEWNACSPAYERALAYMIEQHGWSQVTEVRTLQPSPTAPTETRYDTAVPLPADLVHLIWVRVNDAPCKWDLDGGQIVVNARGAAVTVKGIFSTNSDPIGATPTFVLALTAFVMSGIYRWHEDLGEAAHLWNAGKQILAEAKSRHDMQKPKRAMFVSRTLRARHVRRPAPPPGGWDRDGFSGA